MKKLDTSSLGPIKTGLPRSATIQLIELAEHLNFSGEIGDGKVAQFHELAAMARLEQDNG